MRSPQEIVHVLYERPEHFYKDTYFVYSGTLHELCLIMLDWEDWTRLSDLNDHAPESLHANSGWLKYEFSSAAELEIRLQSLAEEPHSFGHYEIIRDFYQYRSVMDALELD